MVSKLVETRGGKIRSQLIYQWGICHCQSTAIWDCLKKCLIYHSTYGVHCLKCLGLLDFLDSEVVSSGPKPWVPSCQFEAQELFSQTSGISTLDLFWMLEMLGNPDPYMFQASFHNFRAASRVLVGMAEGCWGCNRQARAGCVFYNLKSSTGCRTIWLWLNLMDPATDLFLRTDKDWPWGYEPVKIGTCHDCVTLFLGFAQVVVIFHSYLVSIFISHIIIPLLSHYPLVN